jgi:hypothetical protein
MKEGHIKWLENIMKAKCMSTNAVMNAKKEVEEDGRVNVAKGYSNEGWKMLDAAWFDL